MLLVGYYFWDVFNPIYLSPVYLVLFVLVDALLIGNDSRELVRAILMNFIAVYANFTIACIWEGTIGLGIGFANIFDHYQGTRIMNLMNGIIVLMIALIEIFVLTGQYPL